MWKYISTGRCPLLSGSLPLIMVYGNTFLRLLSFLEDVTKAIDEGKPLDVIYLDFSKSL